MNHLSRPRFQMRIRIGGLSLLYDCRRGRIRFGFRFKIPLEVCCSMRSELMFKRPSMSLLCAMGAIVFVAIAGCTRSARTDSNAGQAVAAGLRHYEIKLADLP